MVDIVSIGFNYKYDSIDGATKALDSNTNAGAKNETQTKKLTSSIESYSGVLSNAERALLKSGIGVSKAEKEILKLDTAYRTAEKNLKKSNLTTEEYLQVTKGLEGRYEAARAAMVRESVARSNATSKLQAETVAKKQAADQSSLEAEARKANEIAIKKQKASLDSYTGSMSNNVRLYMKSKLSLSENEKAMLAQDTALRKLNKDYKAGELSLKQYNIAQKGVKNSFDELINKEKASQKAAQQTAHGFKMMRGGAQQLGFQIQDVAVQAQMGTNALIIIGQQFPQILSIFGGAAGAAAGAVVAIVAAIGNGLLPSLFDAKRSLSEIEQIVTDIESLLSITSGQIDGMSSSLSELNYISEELAQAKLAGALIETKIALKDVDEQLKETRGGMTSYLQDVQRLNTGLGDGAFSSDLGGEQIRQLNIEISQIASNLKISTDEAKSFNDVLAAAKDSGSYTDVLKSLTEMAGASDEPTKGMQNLINSITTLVEAQAKLARAQKGIEDGSAEQSAELTKLNRSLERQIEVMRSGKKDSLEWAAAQKLGIDDIKKLDKTTLGLISTLKKLKKQREEDEARDKGLKLYKSERSAIRGAMLELRGYRHESELTTLQRRLEAGNVAPELIDSILDEKRALLDLKKEKRDTAAFEREAAANNMAMLSLQGYNKEVALSAYRQNLLAKKVSPEMVDALVDQKEAWYDLKEAQKDENTLDKLTAKVESFGGAWTKTGSVIVDALGDSVSAIDDFSKRMFKLEGIQKDLNEQRESYIKQGKDVSSIDGLIAKNQNNMTKAQLHGYASLTNAAASYFGEDTKGRKALEATSKAFTVIELAQSAQRAAAYALEAIANQGKGDPYSAFGRITAMTAIMAGLGVLAGGGGSGSSYTPPTAGTGRVLGDSEAQSQSISSAMDSLDVQVDQLAELRGIRNSMTVLSGGIERLAIDIIRTGSPDVEGLGSTNRFSLGSGLFSAGIGGRSIASATGVGSLSALMMGGPIGIATGGLALVADKLTGGIISDVMGSIVGGISKTSKKVVDRGIQIDGQNLGDILANGLEASYFTAIKTTKKKLWGISKKSSTKTQLDDIDNALLNQFQSIFGNVADVVEASVSSLGITGRDLEDFQLRIEKISFHEKTGEEIEKELNALFSGIGDDIAEYASPLMREFQDIGEGALETLVRVAQETAIFTDAIDLMGMSLAGMTSEQTIRASQNIIDLSGGIENFSDNASEFFDEFLSEQEQFEIRSKSLVGAFRSLGLGLFTSRQEFTEYLRALDPDSPAHQGILAGLMELLPTLDEYYDTLEVRERELKDLRLDALSEEQSILQGVVNRFLPSAQASAVSVEEALRAARAGDFSLAGRLSPEPIGTSGFSSNVDFRIARARQAADLAEIGRLAQNQLSDVDKQIAAMEKGDTMLLDAANEQLSVSEKQLEALNSIASQYDAGGAVSTTNSSGAQNNDEVKKEMADIQKQMRDISSSIAQKVTSIARDVDRMVNDGVPVRTEGNDVVRTKEAS